MKTPTYSLRSPFILDKHFGLETINDLACEVNRFQDKAVTVDCPANVSEGKTYVFSGNDSELVFSTRDRLATEFQIPRITRFLDNNHAYARWFGPESFQHGIYTESLLPSYRLLSMFIPLTTHKIGGVIRYDGQEFHPHVGDILVMNTQRCAYEITPLGPEESVVFLIFGFAVPIEFVIPM